MSDRPVISGRIRVGTIYVNGRTGQVTLEDVTDDAFDDARVVLDLVSGLRDGIERKLTESVIRSHEPIMAVAEAVKEHLPTVLAPMVEDLVLRVLEARSAVRKPAPSVVLAPPGARVRGPGG